MPLYETVFIARQDIPAQEADALAEKYSGIVSEHGGLVARREYWGLRTLAYRIKKNRKGHYTMFHLDAPAEAVSEMERNMRLDEDILRYLTIRSDSLDDKPSVIMQSRTAREERTRQDTGGDRRQERTRQDTGGARPETADSSSKAPSSGADDPKKEDGIIVKENDEVVGESA